MKNYGVVAEYNPFHNGHLYHLSQLRSAEGGVAVVMSGNYVERSETAVVSKRYRTEMALENGADLVLELPLAYATASAERFALGSVYLLNSLGIIDALSFGSECGDVEKLRLIADAVVSPENDKMIKEELEKGISYPSARQNVLEKVLGSKTAEIVSQPNNILGIEYIKALNRLGSVIRPETISRKGAEHDSEEIKDNIISASALRGLITENKDYESFVPQSVSKILQKAEKDSAFPSDFLKLETAIIAFLRKSHAENFKNIPDVSEGIENRIISAAGSSKTLGELYDNAKTKRYTHSRIRRIVLCAYLGITNDYLSSMPQYIRVLGFNQKGREMLKSAKTKASLPIVMSASDIKKLSATAQKQYELECRSTAVYNMTLPEIAPCGTEMTDNVVIFE